MSDQKNELPKPDGLPQQPPFPPVDPRMLAAMYGMQQEDEIDLLEYWRILWGAKKLILSVSFAAAILAVGVSLQMPNIYRAEVLLAPAQAEGGKSGLSSALGGFGGLASLAGVSLPGGGNVEENLAVLTSREFIWKFIKDEKLMPILFADAWDAEKGGWEEDDAENQPSLWDAYRLFSGLLSTAEDKKSGLITVGIEWTDPALSARWANQLVHRLNEFLRQQAIDRSKGNLVYLNNELLHIQVADMRRALFELISQEQKKSMLANTQQEFAFKVVDSAVAPDKKSKPKRSLMVVLATLVAGFLSVLIVLIRHGVAETRKEA